MNKAILVGRLGDDPELRSTNSDTSVCNFSIATNRSWQDDQGNTQEETEWHRIVVFGGSADACNEYLESGRQVCVEGRIQTNEWEDDDGNTRYTTEIVANNVEFLGGGDDGGRDEDYSDESFDDDDIPF